MTALIDAINDALAQPPGNPQLLAEAMRYFLSPQHQYYGPERKQLAHPAIADGPPWMGEHRILEHLAAGRWSTAFLSLENKYVTHTSLVLRGFAEAPIDEVAALLTALPGLAKDLFVERVGDDPASILALRAQCADPLSASALLFAAIAAHRDPPPAIEAECDRWGALPPKLVRRALAALGPQRAAALIDAQLASLPADDEQERLWQLCALGPLLGPALDRATIDRVFIAFDAFDPYGAATRCESFGEHLALHHPALSEAATLLLSRVDASADDASRARWTRALHRVLGALARRNAPIEPSFDHAIDPALAAPLGGPARDAVNLVLGSIGPARAEAVLDRAWQRYAGPVDRFWFLRDGLSEAYLLRLAEALVALRDEPPLLDVLMILPFAWLGSPFVAALQSALADVKPKKTFVTKLLRALSPTDGAALSSWLETRPEPKKSKKK
jgi:hypothetical protein